MARIGNTKPQARIYDYARHKYQPEYDMNLTSQEPTNGQTAYQKYHDKPLTPQKLIFSPYTEVDFKLGDTKQELEKILERKKQIVSGLNNKIIGKPKTMYEMKIGSRSEGSFYDQAKTKPYVEITPGISGLKGDIHQQAPATDMLTDNEVYELTTVFKPSMIKPKTTIDNKIEETAKLTKPYEYQVIANANENTRDFMEAKLGNIEVYPSTATGYGGDDGGSNIKFNYAQELNKGLEPKTTKQLYEETFLNPKSVSNVNMMQRDAQKARDVLGLFGNKQHLTVSETAEPRLTNRMLRPHSYMGLISKKQK
jgi:hypothetical protein